MKKSLAYFISANKTVLALQKRKLFFLKVSINTVQYFLKLKKLDQFPII